MVEGIMFPCKMYEHNYQVHVHVLFWSMTFRSGYNLNVLRWMFFVFVWNKRVVVNCYIQPADNESGKDNTSTSRDCCWRISISSDLCYCQSKQYCLIMKISLYVNVWRILLPLVNNMEELLGLPVGRKEGCENSFWT